MIKEQIKQVESAIDGLSGFISALELFKEPNEYLTQSRNLLKKYLWELQKHDRN